MEVAAAVVLSEDGRFLLAQRPPGKPYAGYWEFPGGKVEEGESAEAALRRELHEELGIQVEQAYPWITRDYDYPHAAVRLRFFRVATWRGTLHGRESQQFAWQSLQFLNVSPVLPANGPVLRALALPQVYGITNAAALGASAFLERAERALASGLRLIQFREKTLDQSAQRDLATRLIGVAHRFGARVLVNGAAQFAREVGADGVHLDSRSLLSTMSRPDFDLVGASCHDEFELQHAEKLGADLAVLGPVQATPSHPGDPTLGWQSFAALTRNRSLPVFALGGMRPSDLPRAWGTGAHGISMLGNAW
jgi:8-oxo-dGTP diphosphatase